MGMRYAQFDEDKRPTVKIKRPGETVQKRYVIQLGATFWKGAEKWTSSAGDALVLGWGSAHRFLAGRPDLEGAKVVRL